MNILVAYDGSNVSQDAVKLAIKHARAFNGRIILVQSMVGGPEIPRREFENTERGLQYQESLLKESQIDCEAHLSVRGLEAGEDLVQLAQEKEIGEIILGVRKRSKVGKLIFGSTAQYVILNAPCPVVSVR